MTPTADEVVRQKRQADQLKRDVEQRAREQRALYDKQISDIDGQILKLQEMRNKISTEKSKLASAA